MSSKGTLVIDKSKLTVKEKEILKSVGSNPVDSIKSLVKFYVDMKTIKSKDTVLDFIDLRLKRTSDYMDRITLKDMYDLYCDDMQHKTGQVLGKKEFSKAMEVAGIKRTKAPQNKNVFCFVVFKTEEDLEDEEWEL